MDQHFQQLLANFPVIITEIDHSGKIVFLNRAAPGFSVDSFIGQTVFSFLPEEVQANVKKAIHDTISTGFPQVYLTTGKFGDKVLSYENHVSLLNPKEPAGNLLIVSTDVTEKKQTEEALEQSEARFRTLVEHTPDVYAIHCEGRLVYLNPAGMTLLGIKDVSGLKDLSVLNYLHPDDRHSVEQRIRESFMTWLPAPRMEERFILPGGREFRAEVTGIPVLYDGKPAMQVILHDVTTQRRSEIDLKLKEKQQSLILNSLPVIFYRVRPDNDFPTIWISDQVTKITGYVPADFLNNPTFWESKIHPDERNDILREYRNIIHHDSIFLEYRWLCADGSWHWFSDHLVLIRDNQGNPTDAAGIWLDISDRKRTESALRENEQKYRLLADNSADVIWTMDTDGRFTYCSPSIEKLRGYTAEEVLHMGMADVLTPASFDSAKEIMSRTLGLIRQGAFKSEAVAVELEQTCKDGSTVWTESMVRPILSESGLLTGFLGVTRNIDERRRSREILEQAEMKFRGLVEHAPDGVVLISAEGAFLYASPASCRMMGYEATEINNFRPESLTHPDDLAMVTENLVKLTIDPSFVPTIQYRFLHKNGSWVWIESTFSNMIQIPGVGGIVINFRDITQRKQDEEELIRARYKAEESDRLKSAFLANVSHEIRTPMNAIVGFSEMLSDESISPNERKRYTSIIQNRSDDLMHIINDLLEISRIESGSFTVSYAPVLMNRFLDELYQEFAQKLKNSKKSHLTLSIIKPLHEDASRILTDPHILKQVFSNLIDNAIKYTHQGTVEFGYNIPENGKFTCYVSDTGIGITEENQKIIFQHFRRGDFEGQQQYSGTGLGLSICKGNLKLLGGDITVESTPGKGSRFIFHFPYHPSMVKNEQTPDLTPQPLQNGQAILPGRKILVTEDEETNMEFLKIILSKAGAVITETYSGTQVRSLYNRLDDFDVALIDVRLPDASGWDIIREIKQIAPSLPVIAQTAYAMASDRQLSEKAGCNGFIPKPIRKDELLDMVRNLCSYQSESKIQSGG